MLFAHTASAQVSVQDSVALVDLYNYANGYEWINQHNWLTTQPVSTWYGVQVQGGRVSSLQLPNNELMGTIPASLSDLTELRSLDLSNNHIQTITSLNGLTKLYEFDCSNNQLAVLPALKDLGNVEIFACANNQLERLIKAEFMASLRVLKCGSNAFVELPALEDFPNLKQLSCYANELTSLPALSSLAQLEILECQHNYLSSLPNLGGLQNLTILNCQNNFLMQLPSLTALIELEEVRCQNNKLTSLPDLDGLGSLQELICSNNQIQDIPDLTNTPQLATLHCQLNQLEFDDIAKVFSAGITQTIYSPQAALEISRDTIGTTLMLSVNTPGNGHTYQWYKNGVALPLQTNPTSISANLLIHQISAGDTGRYACEVKNTDVPNLRLQTTPVSICRDQHLCDLNDDSRCDLLDLPYLANTYGRTGPNRLCGQTAPAWGGSFQGKDLGEFDCTGDGVLDIQDTTCLGEYYDPLEMHQFLVTNQGEYIHATLSDSLVSGGTVIALTHDINFANTVSNVNGLVFMREIIPPPGYVVVTAYHDTVGSVLAQNDPDFINFTRFFPMDAIGQNGVSSVSNPRIEVGLYRSDRGTLTLTNADRVSSCVVVIEIVEGKNTTQNIGDRLPLTVVTRAKGFDNEGNETFTTISEDILYYTIGYESPNTDILLTTQPTAGEVPLKWVAHSSLVAGRYTLERTNKRGEFEELYEVSAYQAWENAYTDVRQSIPTTYRIRFDAATGDTYYSNVVEVLPHTLEESSLWVYPNPTTENEPLKVIYETQNSDENSATVTLVNTLGEIIFMENYAIKQPKNLLLLSVPKLPMGVYTLVMTTNTSTTYSKKIIVH